MTHQSRTKSANSLEEQYAVQALLASLHEAVSRKSTYSPPVRSHGLLGQIYRLISTRLCTLYHYFAAKLWRMPKNYSLGVNRFVSVKKQDGDIHVTIGEEGSDVKTVTLPSRRWAQFVLAIDQVNEAVDQLAAKQYVALNLHIGGKFYISVTTGFQCVDIRQYYYNWHKGVPSPTKNGIAIRLQEWNALKEIVQQLHKKHPTLASAQSCSRQLDHQNLEGALACLECHPFQYDQLLHSVAV